MTADTINSLFEFAAGIVIWMNVAKLYRDQKVRGVVWPLGGFFAVAGLWSVGFLVSLGQTTSAVGAGFCALGNCTWTALAFCWRSR